RRIADVDVAVDQDGDAAERAQAAEFVIAEEGRDRVDLVPQALEVHARQHLADIGADEASDDFHAGVYTPGGRRAEAGWTRCKCSATDVASLIRKGLSCAPSFRCPSSLSLPPPPRSPSRMCRFPPSTRSSCAAAEKWS